MKGDGGRMWGGGGVREGCRVKEGGMGRRRVNGVLVKLGMKKG